MTGSETTARKSAPLWALLIGAAVASGGVILLVHLLGDQVRAAALGAAESRLSLLLALSFGELLLALAVWGVLRAIGQAAWRKRGQPGYGWLGVLLGVSLMTGAFALALGLYNARSEADRAVAETERVERAAVEHAVAGFPGDAESGLVAAVFREMRFWADPIKDVRALSVSRDPGGTWEAVCGQVAFKPGHWEDFVSHRFGAGSVRAALEQDGFDDARRKTCRPIVDKYVGVEGVDVAAAIAAMKALGCSDLDINYWEAEKTYCHGRIVRPKS